MLENNMENLEEQILKVIKKYDQGGSFSGRKLTDTPTDLLSVVNKRFVTANGLVANRPVSSVAVVGQTYFATDTNIPMVFSSGGWRNGVGSVVAIIQ